MLWAAGSWWWALPTTVPCHPRLAPLSRGCSGPQAAKNEALEVTYSFWDGAGHRRSAQVKKGDTILAFLQAALKQLAPDFRELRWARMMPGSRVWGAGFCRTSLACVSLVLLDGAGLPGPGVRAGCGAPQL